MPSGVAPALLALATAYVASRILAPARATAGSDPVDLRDHFSEQEIARGRRFARAQMALGAGPRRSRDTRR